jgi:membrane protein required for colicin V production
MLYKVEFIKEKTRKYVKNSIVFPICLEVGEKIINLSPKDLEKLTKNVKISKN